MYLNYWSLGHILSILLPILFIIVFYFLLRKRTPKTQKIVILTLMLINVVQHILKPWVWYPLFHGVFSFRTISFCNVCASMILLSPIIFIFKNKTLKDSLFFLGNLGGIMSLWFITIENGIYIFSWEYIRYFSCHAILMMTSTLPVLLGLHTLSLKNFWKVCLCFFGVEAIAFLNNYIYYLFKNDFDFKVAYDIVYTENEIIMCHAPTVEFFQNAFNSNFHMKYVVDDGTCFYIPILWSSPAQYPVITLFVLFWMWLGTKIKLNGHYLTERKQKEEIETK